MGLLIVISGPSGVGKTTIAHQIVKQLGASFSISMTTRPITDADIDGKDYHFVSEKKFLKTRDANQLLEWAKVFDYYYGTPRQPVVQAIESNHDILLEIDVLGTIQVKKAMPQALSIFVLPPSEDELLNRLRNRAREDEDVIQRRFSEAKHEIEQAKTCGSYDHFIVNDNLETAIAETIKIVTDHKRTASSV